MYILCIYCTCTDVNECSLGIDNCHREADCINQEGLFDCRCQDGFLGDGINCCVSELSLIALVQEEEGSNKSRKSRSKKRKGRSGELKCC